MQVGTKDILVPSKTLLYHKSDQILEQVPQGSYKSYCLEILQVQLDEALL